MGVQALTATSNEFHILCAYTEVLIRVQFITYVHIHIHIYLYSSHILPIDIDSECDVRS